MLETLKIAYCDRCHRQDGIKVRAVDRIAIASTTRKGTRRFEDLCLDHALLVAPDLVVPEMIAAAQADGGTRSAVGAKPLPGIGDAANRKNVATLTPTLKSRKPRKQAASILAQCPDCPQSYEGPDAPKRMGAHRFRAHGVKGSSRSASQKKKVAAAHVPRKTRQRRKVGVR